MDPCGLECDALTLLVLNAKGEGSTDIGLIALFDE